MKKKIMFEGVLKECECVIDRNGEYLCRAEDGDFAKFSKEGDLDELIEAHNDANSVVPEIIPEVVYGNQIHFDTEGNEIKK